MSTSDTGCWWKPLKESGDLTVVHVDLTPHASREASAFSWLDEYERSRSHEFLQDGARRRYVMCRAVTRVILSSRLGCRNEQLSFGASRYAKPFAILDGRPAPISFNVSHSGGHGLVAVAPIGRVGVDLEERVVRHNLDSLIDYVLGPNEQAHLAKESGRGKADLFFKLWTIKEALLKALGTGFHLDMSKFEVPSDIRVGTEGIFRFPHMPAIKWRVMYLGTDEYAAAAAHETP